MNCPNLEVLSALLTSSLTDDEEARLRAHLGGCSSCRSALDLATDDHELSRWVKWARASLPYEREEELERVINRAASFSESLAEPLARSSIPVVLGPPLVEGDLGALGGYRVVREIGRGGLGVVFEGHDPVLGRSVAIKVPRMDRIGGDHRRHLAREARHAARFRHDHVVVVHAVEETAEGVPFIVMEYIPGPSLGELLRERTRLSPHEAAELAAQAAEGLAAAHEAGLIHRDIKPANLLVDPATGRLRIVDFGLARAADASNTFVDGSVIGTPNYMSPEQARGESAVDARTDQYSLGATLYEMLTGEPPFRGTPARVVHQVLEDEPRPPRQLNEAIPRDLETICLKTLAKDPRGRYPSAVALAADLRRWLRGEPILARHVGPIGRLVRWGRRNRRVAALAATSFLLLAALAAGSLAAAARIEQARRLEAAERGRADEQAEQARQLARVAADRARVAVEQRTLALETIGVLIKEAQNQLGGSSGTLPLRRRLADAAIARLDRIAADPAGGADAALARVMAHERLGELSFLAGRTDAARNHYQSSRDQAAALAATADPRVRAQADGIRALCLDKLGDLALYAANLDEARACYQQSLELREALPDSERQSPEGLRGRAVSQNKLGDLALRLGRLDQARSAYKRGLALTEACSDPDSQRHQFDLRFVHSRLGDVALTECEFDGAEKEYRLALGHAEAQLKADPDDARARREVPVCYSKLGALALRRGDPAGALEFYQKYLAGSEALAAANPSSAEARRDLLVAVSLVADSHFAAPDYPAAERFYRRCLDLARTLSRDDPRSLQKRMDIDELLTRLADLELRRERFDRAAEWLEQARANIRETAESGLVNAAKRAEYDAAFTGLLDVCRHARQALGDPAWIATQPAGRARGLWAVRALTFARRGEVAAALEAAAALGRFAPGDVDSLVFAARAYALCFQAQGAAQKPVTETRETAKKALDSLREALRIRPTLFQAGTIDPDLNPLFALAEFRRLLKPPASP